MNIQGLIIKATAGFYYVQCGGRVLQCRARGIFRREGISPLVGDRVRVSAQGETEGTVEEILPRRNSLARPPVANIDRLVIVASVVNPPPVLLTVDKLTAIAVHNGIEPVTVFTKTDLQAADGLTEIYRRAGIAAFAVSSATGEGIGALRLKLAGGVSVFTGNSGVGKSSLLNRICPGLSLTTGEVSRKLGRGRHTTRTVEFYPFANGSLTDGALGEDGAFVADTPGFSSLEITGEQLIRKEELPDAFPEFASYIGRCRYTGCAHVREEGCAVRDAVARGDIAPSRHASYRTLYEEVRNIHDWELKKDR